jgi:hypothetical protein
LKAKRHERKAAKEATLAASVCMIEHPHPGEVSSRAKRGDPTHVSVVARLRKRRGNLSHPHGDTTRVVRLSACYGQALIHLPWKKPCPLAQMQ